MRKLTEFEKTFGVVCKVCKLRKGTIFATGKSEPGRTGGCQCDDKKKRGKV